MSKDRTYTRLIASARWSRLAMEIKTKAGWRCSACGRVTRRLAVHHITPVETARSEAEAERLCFDKSNLTPLCYVCHAEHHKAERLSLKAKTQERASQRVDRFISQWIGDG